MIGIIAAAALASGPSHTEITIYNSGFGLVKELRQLHLKQGRQNVNVEDVAAMIEPTSVSIHSITDPNAFTVLEQNYQYDLISPQAILNKSVGQRVRFTRAFGNQRDTLEGVLLSSPTSIVSNPDGQSQSTYDGMVIKTDDGRIVLDPTGEVEVTQVPAGLISKPTLMWDIDAAKSGDSSVELSYISQGLNWAADYVVTLNGLGSGDLQGWVTLNNTSGATWENASLKLLAGDVHRVQAVRAVTRAMPGMAFGGGRSESAFQEEALFEYHLYTLERPATVRNRETKQLSLLQGHDIPIHKKLIVDSIAGNYFPGEGEIGTGDIKPQVRLEFVNDKASGLGMPLPKGKVKVYQRDQSGSVQLLGEDEIGHTPRDERVSLVVGKSFDVVSTRKRTNFTRISDRSVRESFEIEVRNRKETAETVYVIERHYSDWSITEKSQPFEKLDSNTAQFVVELKPGQVKKVVYTVETKW
jgi:hypothetical protein